MGDVKLISSWKGRPITELTREELLEVVDLCGREIISLRQDRDRWRESSDPLKYLSKLSKDIARRG